MPLVLSICEGGNWIPNLKWMMTNLTLDGHRVGRSKSHGSQSFNGFPLAHDLSINCVHEVGNQIAAPHWSRACCLVVRRWWAERTL